MKIAVLSALNIAGELFEFKAKYDENAEKVNELGGKNSSIDTKNWCCSR